MKRIFCLSSLSFAILLAGADTPYDFRVSVAYKHLSVTERERLEQVVHDQVLIWGALDMFADEHSGTLPATLDELVPQYLSELPSDPFATAETASERKIGSYTQSKAGWGYRYMRGAPGNRAWVISSVGLPDFPYLAERGNVGLYRCKGLWISGVNPAAGRAFKVQ